MSNDIMLGGEFYPGDDGEGPKPKRVKHIYHSNDCALKFINVLRRWKARNNFKAIVTIDPDKLGKAMPTVWQMLHHGRAYIMDNQEDFSTDDVADARAVLMKQQQTVVRLEYRGRNYVVEKLEDAMEFGEEAVDCQQLFIDWIESSPAVNQSWPPAEMKLILTDRDLVFFRNAIEEFERKNAPYLFRIEGQTVKVIRIDNELL